LLTLGTAGRGRPALHRIEDAEKEIKNKEKLMGEKVRRGKNIMKNRGYEK